MDDKRVYRQPLEAKWAAALLRETSSHATNLGDLPQLPVLGEHFTVQDLMQHARTLKNLAVADARRVLADHPLADVVAQAAAREAGKRGEAKLAVADDGTMLVEVRYKGASKAKPKPKPQADGDRRHWKTALPSLEALREEAAAKGIDIEDLGRAKKKIMARLAGGAPTPAPKPKRIKRAPALTPATIVQLPQPVPEDPSFNASVEHPPETEPEPDPEADVVVDEAHIQAAIEAKAAKPRVNMAALASQVDDLDLDGLLSRLDQGADED
jgi:hypothetical protein